jgi:hypothetical protein
MNGSTDPRRIGQDVGRPTEITVSWTVVSELRNRRVGEETYSETLSRILFPTPVSTAPRGPPPVRPYVAYPGVGSGQYPRCPATKIVDGKVRRCRIPPGPDHATWSTRGTAAQRRRVTWKN